MSLITRNGILKLIDDGVIENTDASLVNGASLDIRLGESMLVEEHYGKMSKIDLDRRETPVMVPAQFHDGYWALYPGDFALANTVEVFHLPDDVAFEFKLKSSGARAGLEHSLAGWADPGWHKATLTLELRNVMKQSVLLLRPGMRIGQVVFWRGQPVPPEHSYRNTGSYNNQIAATPSKGQRL